MRLGDFTVYFGASSGSTRKVMRELKEPDVMINYATRDNTPFNTIKQLFTDSGGYSFIKGKGEYQTTNAEYLDYVEKHHPHRFALRDYPCEPDVLEKHGRTVSDHQHMTVEAHSELLDQVEDRGIKSEPMSVIQGWETPEYLNHIDMLREAGALTDVVGVGSVCRRNATADILAVLNAVSDCLSGSAKMHAFGVKTDVLRGNYPDRLKSVDTHSYDYRARYHAIDHNYHQKGGEMWLSTT
jgi:hypothetical protein